MSQILNRIEREMRHQRRTPAQLWTRRITIACLVIAIPLLGGELALRVAGFHRPQIDMAAQQRSLDQATSALNARFGTNAFVADSHLLWKLKPGANLSGLQVDESGLLTWERSTAGTRTANPVRILCLGDSVTAVTYKTYPQITETLATAGSQPLQISNAAVPGYTTEQALRLTPQLKNLAPDVVVICFGWNDHFPALNLPDRELGAAHAGGRFLHKALRNLRLYQLAGAPLGTQRPLSRETPGTREQHDYRVPPAQFEENLRKLVDMARSWSAIPVLATQPENLHPNTEQFLESNSFIAPDDRDNKSLHRQYNQITRTVANTMQVPLLDIDEEFVRRPRDFMLEPDGIHLTGRGHNHVARLVLGVLKNEGQLSTGNYDAIARAEKHDTTAPDKPRVTWSVLPEHVSAAPNQPFTFSVIPQNSGNTRWLRRHVVDQFGLEKNVHYGSSSVYARWRTIDAPTTGTVAEVPIPSDILPGEATSMTLTLQAPPDPGNYELEIGISAARIGPLSRYGAESTTLTVTTITP